MTLNLDINKTVSYVSITELNEIYISMSQKTEGSDSRAIVANHIVELSHLDFSRWNIDGGAKTVIRHPTFSCSFGTQVGQRTNRLASLKVQVLIVCIMQILEYHLKWLV